MPLPCWLTVTVCPATVSVPLRAPLAAATEKVTVPLPVPLAPDVIVMKSDRLVAVQVQDASVVTFTVNVPPLVAEFTEVGDTAKEQVPAVRNVSTFEKGPVAVPFVARARQYHNTLGPRSLVSTQLVVPPDPWATPSAVNVRTGSSGNVFRSDTSKRYVTVPPLPDAVALFTTSVGLAVVTVTPPIGELALGAEKVTGVGGGVDVAARCV